MKRHLLAALTITALSGIFTINASAAALGFTGTGGFIVAGGIGDLAGLCAAGCDSGFVPFNTGALLADGMVVSGLVRETIQEDGLGDTTSALLRVTNIVATNTNVGGGAISDTMFLVSDQFDPSLPGPVGVGIIGAFLSNAGLGGNISFDSTQAEMNFLTTGLITQAAFGGPLTGFTLDTVDPFVSCVACSPVGFWAADLGFDPVGGVEQLIGAINFTIGPGASIALPGSLLIEDNDNADIQSELPEPSTVLLLGGALGGIGLLRRKLV